MKIKKPNYFKIDITTIELWEKNLYLPCQYKVLYGGRDSGKSTNVAKALLRLSFEGTKTIVCCREYYKDIGVSVYKLFVKIIENSVYKDFFIVKTTEMYGPHILNKMTGSIILFKGIRDTNSDSIKSVDNINYIWLEEGAYLSREAWNILDPTLRESGCEFWLTMNPRYETDHLYQEFIENGYKYGDKLYLCKLSWRNNKYLSEESYTRIVRMREHDYETYIQVYEGECIRNSELNVFRKEFFVISEFEEPQGIYPYFGLDFGWTDASAGIRCYIHEGHLYVTHEFKKSHISVDMLGDALEKALKDYKKNGNYIITADSSSPDLINLLNKYGYRCKPALKGKGSIEAGIAHIKTFKKCFVHPRCVEFLKEAYNLKYQVDKASGHIKDKIEDKNNHLIDSWRYSLEDCMKNRYNKEIEYTNTLSNVSWV